MRAARLRGTMRCLRAAVEVNSGTSWKMTGDGIYAAFDDPLDALEATLALQRRCPIPAATNGIPLRVRCGLHLGVVERARQRLLRQPRSTAPRGS